ncbi:MAG: helix-turn-helix domain-containing protein [Oscillospiraceae bacterium]|nr:helix-turn-helix domain-containing protein [Oscillospiraceae bacterium]
MNLSVGAYLVIAIMLGVFVTLIVLIVRALLKYLKSKGIRKEKEATRKSLGEAIQEHRTSCKMTQEFVAEALGVSRQAVSKWENGTSDPSTGNLVALAKLFGISAEDLLNGVGGKAQGEKKSTQT